MPDRVTYYAVVNDLSSRERPAGVFRRTYTEDGGRSDEAFTRNLIWEYSTSLISAERGDLDNTFIEITEDEANEIVAQIRARVAEISDSYLAVPDPAAMKTHEFNRLATACHPGSEVCDR